MKKILVLMCLLLPSYSFAAVLNPGFEDDIATLPNDGDNNLDAADWTETGVAGAYNPGVPAQFNSMPAGSTLTGFVQPGASLCQAVATPMVAGHTYTLGVQYAWRNDRATAPNYEVTLHRGTSGGVVLDTQGGVVANQGDWNSTSVSRLADAANDAGQNLVLCLRGTVSQVNYDEVTFQDDAPAVPSDVTVSAMTANPATFNDGDTITFAFSIANAGGAGDATGLSVLDQNGDTNAPPIAAWRCAGSATCPGAGAAGQINWGALVLPGGDTMNIEVDIVVPNPFFLDILTNQAHVDWDGNNAEPVLIDATVPRAAAGAASVPTMGEWAIALLILVLGGGAYLGLRRQKQA